MKKALMLAAAASMGAVASAQFGNETGGEGTAYNLRARLGIYLPFDDGLRQVSNTFFGLGIDYTLERSLIPGSQTFLSFDWLTKSSRADRGNVFPIMLNQRFYLGEADDVATSRTYAFVGLGVGVIDVNPSSTRFGVRGGLGIEFNQNIFGEATLLISDRARNGGPAATGIGVYLGYRF